MRKPKLAHHRTRKKNATTKPQGKQVSPGNSKTNDEFWRFKSEKHNRVWLSKVDKSSKEYVRDHALQRNVQRAEKARMIAAKAHKAKHKKQIKTRKPLK